MVVSAPLTVIQIPSGEMKNFSYLVICPQTRKGAIVDPSLVPQNSLDLAERMGISVQYIINTHGHRDHIEGNGTVQASTGALVAAHRADAPEADMALIDGTEIPIGLGRLKVLSTPGHTPGSICLYTGTALITGDTLFVTRVGRADFPKSDPADLYKSLLKISDLPDETLIYPGHDYGPQPVSTLYFEKEHNAFMNCATEADFIRLRIDS